MLTSLNVKNFRSLTNLDVPKLGRVNLVVGKNNAGKSSVLEAIRIYAGNANRDLLDEIATLHDEPVRSRNIEAIAAESALPFEDFFSGRIFPKEDGTKIEIGDRNAPNQALAIEHVFLETNEEVITTDTGEVDTILRRRIVSKRDLPSNSDDSLRQGIIVTKGERSVTTFLDSSRVRTPLREGSDLSRCAIVPTAFISMNELARDWDRIALTDSEDVIKQTMQNIVPELEGLTFVEAPSQFTAGRRELGRTARVRLKGVTRPVPLSSLGDGSLRVLQLTLRAFCARDGFLLIDEFENGLHYSVQDDIWDKIFELSLSLNMQIFATTHSWDCIQSFSRIAQRRGDVGGVLFRVGRSVLESNFGKVIATVFDNERLLSITQDDLEVRGL